MTPVEKKTGEIVYGTGLCLDSEEKLLEYLAFLKGRHDDPKSEKSQAFQEFMILLERARKIHKFPVERFDLITLEFFVISQEMAEDDPYTRYRHFLEEIQEILARCEMSEIYIVNPYECFLLMCLLTDCPLAVFSEIWEKSYEEGEEKN